MDIVRSRIAVSATLPVPYRVLRLASAMTAGVDCRCFVVSCCPCCRFLPSVPSPARNPFVKIRVIRGKKNSVPSPARNHSGVDIVRSRIAVSATLPVPYRVLRLAFAMTRRVDCWFFVSLTNSRNVICPLALRSLKTLRALNLGKNKRAVFYDNQDNL